MTTAAYAYPSITRQMTLRYRGSTHGVDFDTGWVRPHVAMTTTGYEYPSTKTAIRYRGSTRGADLDTGWVRLHVTMTIAG